jgi:peptidoglycan/xylan/chitin deacetylase (PgdA/CDA1 family)
VIKRLFAVLTVLFVMFLLLGTAQHQALALTSKQYWERASEVTYKSPEELKAQHDREVRKGEHYSKLMRGDPRVKAVALTFDDGPHPAFTTQILAILKKYKINATFFVVGKMAKQYPNLVKAEAQAGNVIGNHTYDHVNLTKIPDSGIDSEWEKGNAVIKSILGANPVFCRPPGGDYDRAVIQSAMSAGLTTVLWTDDPGDYASPGDRTIERRVLDRIEDGGIVLIHDGIQQTIDVLPQIIEHLRKRGFEFQTVAEMMQGHAETIPRNRSGRINKQSKPPALKVR